MAGKVYKLIQLVGASDKSYEDAVKVAVEKAKQTIHGLAWFEVMEQRGALKDGAIEYQVKLRIAFKLD